MRSAPATTIRWRAPSSPAPASVVPPAPSDVPGCGSGVSAVSLRSVMTPSCQDDRRVPVMGEGRAGPRLGRMRWLGTPAHARWLEREADALLAFAAGSVVDEGFGYLDAEGEVVPDEGVHLWVTCRMIHAFSLGVLLGRPGAASMVDHGLAALAGPLADAEHGGWYAQVGPHGPIDDRKAAYAHAFVVLATSS